MEPKERLSLAQELSLRPVDGWTHHVVNFGPGAELKTRESDRPISIPDRYKEIEDFVAHLPELPYFVVVPDQKISPRMPYVEGQAHLLADGHCWTLDSRTDSLQWIEQSQGQPPRGKLELWFRYQNGIDLRTLVGIRLVVSPKQEGPSSYTIVTWGEETIQRRVVPVTKFEEQVVDIIVPTDFNKHQHPYTPNWAWVHVFPDNVAHMDFKRAGFTRL